LRDWSRPVDWLYTRANLPGLVDGWILADEYRDHHAGGAAIIAAPETRRSRQGDVILKQPTPMAVLDALRHMIEPERSNVAAALTELDDRRQAA
jgi:hypothetical protein